jgi:hypothetical protein
VAELRARSYADFLWRLDSLGTYEPSLALQHGAIVGDDPATTCAFVLKDLTGDAAYWAPVS